MKGLSSGGPEPVRPRLRPFLLLVLLGVLPILGLAVFAQSPSPRAPGEPVVAVEAAVVPTPTRTLALQLGGAGLLLGLVASGLAVGLIRENTRRTAAEKALKVLNRDLKRLVAARTEELRRAEQELLQSRKREAVGRLASGIAHDFNNLLTVIIASAQMLRGSVPRDSPGFRYLVEIDTAGDRAAELTRQLLAFNGTQVTKPGIMDMNDSVRVMRGVLERVVGDHIELAFRLSSDLHPVEFEPGQIEQVLMNLVVNAGDAMPQGGKLTIRTENVELDAAYAAEHPGTRPGPHAVLSVADTGRALTAETRAGEPGRGTGRDLATVYGIVKQGGGDVRVHSEPERGTLFKVFLPAGPGTPVDLRPREAGSRRGVS
ncbi:MAG: hypothetical protein EA350_11115 [Gemmatimonadales bacterium]|nr:MAG: hypothetical protein EA350_11115 [Gemmatimonadales bacterium]